MALPPSTGSNNNSLQHTKPLKIGTKQTSRYPWQLTCSQEEMRFQYKNIDIVDCTICDTEVAWQLAQLLLPRASVFFDMGANLGYTGAKMFGLWSPGHGLNRQTLMKYIKEDNRTGSNSKVEISTVCADGANPDTPLLCPGLYRQYYGNPGNAPPCSYRNEIKVYSFDGEIGHTRNTRALIDLHFPYLSTNSSVNKYESPSYISRRRSDKKNPNHDNGGGSRDFRRARWEYINAAIIGDREMHNKLGYFQQLGHEGSRFDGFKAPHPLSHYANQTIPVPVMTIDGFCEDRGIDVVDVLKLDIEGNELAALMKGANYTLTHRDVKFLTYECLGHCGEGEKLGLINYLDNLGFLCYMNGRNELMARITGCWNNTYASLDDPNLFAPSQQRPPRDRLAGNVYCGHRTRSPQLIAAMEAVSLHTYYGGRRGDIYEGALLGRPAWADGPSQQVMLGHPLKMEQWSQGTGRNGTTGKRMRRPQPLSIGNNPSNSPSTGRTS